jgi:hypothetical protein
LLLWEAVDGSVALNRYKISDVTVSGISSGAYMAVQLHISHSSIINGSAIFAGGPFYCAESNVAYAETKCMDISAGLPQTSKLVSLTLSDAALGYVDDVKYLSDDRVYLFSGKRDSIVNPKVVKELQSYYENFVNAKNIVTEFGIDAEHCFPTNEFGETCTTLSSPYIGKCGFDGAGNALKALFGTLQQPVKAIPSNFIEFNQKLYISSTLTSLGDVGYIYVPTSCASGKNSCRLHIALHGCDQAMSFIGNVFAQYTGYNEWAEANNIIVLYPYAEVSNVNPYNPKGFSIFFFLYTKLYCTILFSPNFIFVFFLTITKFYICLKIYCFSNNKILYCTI